MDVLQVLEEKLNKKGIYDVRQIARALNVRTEYPQKPKIIDAIIRYARGEIAPKPHSLRGAPPKSYEHDQELVAEIEAIRKSRANDGGMGVSDGFGEDLAYVSGVFFTEENEARALCDGIEAEVASSLVLRYGLRSGDYITGTASDGVLFKIESVNGCAPGDMRGRRDFSSLTHVYPEKRVKLSASDGIFCREVDLFCPLGFGERAFITGDGGGVRRQALTAVARGICGVYPRSDVIFSLVNCRPEDATYFKRAFEGCKVFATTFDKPDGESRKAAAAAFGHGKRLLELGRDAVILTDGLFGGKTEGGFLKKLLYSACNAEEGGSLTVISTIAEDCPSRAEMLGFGGAVINAVSGLNGVYLGVEASRSDRSAAYLSKDEAAAAATLRAFGSEKAAEIFGSLDDGRITEKYKNG